MPPVTNNARQQSAKMPAGAINSSSRPVSFVSLNRFSAMEEVLLQGSGYIMPVVSLKSCRHLPCRLCLFSDFRLSCICISRDLNTDAHLTLPCLVNKNHAATCMIDSRASSQSIDLDFAWNLNLPLVLKKKPEDLVLADGVRSKVGQIMHTCTLI